MSYSDKKTKESEIAEIVAEQTGMTPRNVERTYIHNKYNKDKSKHLNVLHLGAICAKEDISEEELEFGIGVIKLKRESE